MIQTIILCGGSGTRLKEMSEFIPKPLIPIGGIPMIVHIMRLYAYYNFKDFVLALGYNTSPTTISSTTMSRLI
jgi:glucose-1-phosphate cytidylyltransferase